VKVIYTPTAISYLNDLVDILYNKGYFSFEQSAVTYVVTLVNDMQATIHLRQKHRAPDSFTRYGNDLWYVSYPKNKRTTWYFFFTYHHVEDIFFIRYITNNHVAGHLLN